MHNQYMPIRCLCALWLRLERGGGQQISKVVHVSQ